MLSIVVEQIDLMKNEIARLTSQVNNLTTENIRLQETIADQAEQIRSLQNKNSVLEYKYNGEGTTSGILYKQYQIRIKCGGHYCNVGSHDPNFPIQNLSARSGVVNYHSQGHVSEFLLNKSESDSYIEFDFNDCQIQLSSYLIYSNSCPTNIGYHPKTWRIVGYNNKEDQNSWDVLDRQVNYQYLNAPKVEQIFNVHPPNNEKKYRFIRYIQEENFALNGLTVNHHNVNIGGFDLFGKVFQK